MFNFEKMAEKFEARKLERIRKAYAKMVMEKIFDGFDELCKRYDDDDIVEALSKWNMDNMEEIIEVLMDATCEIADERGVDLEDLL